MTSPPENFSALACFPASLRDLVIKELQAGNSILRIDTAHSAPSAGASVHLARKISTHPRHSTALIHFIERHHPTHSVQFSDLSQMFFIVEPPNDPSVEPDMNAIRTELEARERAANCDRFRPNGGLW